MTNWSNLLFQESEITGRYFKLLPIISKDYNYHLVKSYPMGFLNKTRIYDRNDIFKRIKNEIYNQDTTFIVYLEEIFVLAINDLNLVKYIKVHKKLFDHKDIQLLIKYRDNYHFSFKYNNIASFEITNVFEPKKSLIPQDVLITEKTLKDWCIEKQPMYIDDFIEERHIDNYMDVVEDYIKSRGLNIDLSKYHSEIRDLILSDILS